MAEFTNIELRKARESRNWPRWKLAGEIGVSESTVERWEIGEKQPEPDDVDHIGNVLDMPEIWHQWMLSHYDSYRARYINVQYLDNPIADLVRMKHEYSDVEVMFDKVERSLLTGVIGKIDDPELRGRFKDELKEVIAAMQQVLIKIKD